MILRRQLPHDRVQHACWFYAPELEGEYPGGWKHIATVDTPINDHLGVHFKDAGSFLEQWTHSDSRDLRMAFYGPAYYKENGGAWGQSRVAQFRATWLEEREENQQVRGDYVSAGPGKHDDDEFERLWMSTGGMLKPSLSMSSGRFLDFPDHRCGLPYPLYAFDRNKNMLLSVGNVPLVEERQANTKCGNHMAESCEACPFDDAGNNHWAGWCNGECVWEGSQCIDQAEASQCSDSDTEVHCGGHGHVAASCSECTEGHGESWCNGDCYWKDGSCVDV